MNTLPDRWTGLYYFKKSLVAVMPWFTEGPVARFFLNDDLSEIDRLKILLADDPLLSQPTTGVIVKNKFYFVATSNLQLFARLYRENGGRVEPGVLPPVRIGVVRLD